MTTDYLAGFSRERVTVTDADIFLRCAGSGPVVLLLHGYPQTHLAWRHIAPQLAKKFTVVAADLPGYGDSTLSGLAGSDTISKRTMARVLVEVMTSLGASRFAIAGHDRGGRVAYRLALDHPERVAGVAVLDIIPILDMADGLTYTSARQMAHWFWLSQSSRVPETLIGLDPTLYLRYIIDAWGGAKVIEQEVFEEYRRCMSRPDVIGAIGAEYRSDQVDLDHDRSDRAAGRRLQCPLLALWAEAGLPELFGPPLSIWRNWADRVSGGAIAGGHFMMEESPRQVLAELQPFLTNAFAQ